MTLKLFSGLKSEETVWGRVFSVSISRGSHPPLDEELLLPAFCSEDGEVVNVSALVSPRDLLS